jgi:hypothetical protein
MSDKNPNDQELPIKKSPDTIRNEWEAGTKGIPGALFQPEEFDIFVNKMTLEAYVFHEKKIDYTMIDHLEYDHKSYSVDVVYTNGSKNDLGMKIQWMIRPYWSKAQEVSIVRTENQKSQDGKTVPLIHKNA